jgi:hypothetical protein
MRRGSYWKHTEICSNDRVGEAGTSSQIRGRVLLISLWKWGSAVELSMPALYCLTLVLIAPTVMFSGVKPR